MFKRKTAFIVIDSGFSLESLAGATNLIGLADLSARQEALYTQGRPVVEGERLTRFAGDPTHHGSIVLERLLAVVDADSPLVLVRAFDQRGRRVDTAWSEGRIAADGWTEAYLWAVELCRKRGYNTVTNCSFGSFTHACDGTGWEAFQLGKVTGPGRPGHVLVAAAGPGDGRSGHASLSLLPGSTRVVSAYQERSGHYNFWAGPSGSHWRLSVLLDGQEMLVFDGARLGANLWNGRQQQTFEVAGTGLVQLALQRPCPPASAGEASGLRFDCYADGARFLDHVDPVYISQPACLPQALAVGLKLGRYSPDQEKAKAKPDVLLSGDGQISFLLPAVSAVVARCLEDDPSLDVDGVKDFLGKVPNLGAMLPGCA